MEMWFMAKYALSDEEVMKMYKTDTLAEGSFIS